VQERKLVTALFCDYVGSTGLGERLDPEALRNVQASYFDRMRSVVQQFGGTLEKFIGDAVVAVFGVPLAHEDDAERAVRCGLAMRDALGGLNDSLLPRLGVELEVRIGIATGEALVSGGEDALATGDVMNTAARLEQGAAPGEILVERETMQLSRDAIAYRSSRLLEARGKREPLEAWAAEQVAARGTRARAALVGRERELQILAGAVEEAIRGEGTRVLVLLGEPGIGKTRVAEEFARRLAGRASVYRGACLPYGEGTAWLPLAQVVQADAGIAEGDFPETSLVRLRERLALRHPPSEAAVVEAQLAPLVGAARTPVASGAELLWALRRYLEALASTAPTVLVMDDLHWASENLLELIEELVETIAAVPLVIVCQGRPELREQIAGVVASEHAQTLELGPLSLAEARRLAGNLKLDKAGVERAEGNPLFLEELAAMASEGSGTAVIPQSLRALIGARLDLLPPEAKRVVQVGAVVGDVFWDVIVSTVLGTSVQNSVFRMLRTRGLVEEDLSSPFVGARQFRFHHALIREVAYESVSKQERGELHQHVATWLEERTAEHPGLSVSVAHHLDRALSLTREVSPLESPDPKLVERAVTAQWRAEEWAETNAAQSESLRFARRAVALAESSQTLRARSRARLGRALIDSGLQDEGLVVAQEVLEGQPSDEARAYVGVALAQVARDRSDIAGIRAHAEPALRRAQSARLDALEASVLTLLAWADIAEGRHSDAEGRMARAAEICLRRGDLAGTAMAVGVAGIHAMWRGALDQAEAHATVAMRYAAESGSLRAEAQTQTLLAHLRREQGRLEEAVEHGRERLRLKLELGDTFKAIGACALTLAQPLILLGRLDEAWQVLEQGAELAARIGATWFDDAIRAQRAEILRLRGRIAEAEAELGATSTIGAPLFEQSASAAELARLHALHGRDQEAEAIWRALLEQPFGENVLEAARARIHLAGFLTERGRAGEAAELLAEARTAIEGSHAGLVESQLDAVETLLVRA
jgi:class 3 adenylate cyclase/tetratricopeptide (TPR) repeat protein